MKYNPKAVQILSEMIEVIRERPEIYENVKDYPDYKELAIAATLALSALMDEYENMMEGFEVILQALLENKTDE